MQRRAAPKHRRAPASPGPGRRTLVAVAGIAGELLVTAGALVLLFVAYTLWGTGLQTAAAQNDLRDQFEQHLLERSGTPSGGDSETEAEGPGDDGGTAAREPLELGDAYGILRIPRFGDGWERIVVEGTEPGDLKDGPGHYADSADPGHLGNVAIAAHRSGHGEPFARFAELREGDIVEIETVDGVFRYELDDAPDGDDDGNVIESTELWVVDPVPGEPAGTEPAEARITLTTCWPRWGSEKRMYATGVLVDERPRTPAGSEAAG